MKDGKRPFDSAQGDNTHRIISLDKSQAAVTSSAATEGSRVSRGISSHQ